MTSKTSNTKKSEAQNSPDFEVKSSEVAKWQEWKEKAEETAYTTIPQQIDDLKKEKELNEAIIEMCEKKIEELNLSD